MNLCEALNEASASIARRDAEVRLLRGLDHEADRTPHDVPEHGGPEHRQEQPRRAAVTLDRAWLLAHGDEPIRPADLARLRVLTARRAAREPLQHLTGVQEFYALPLRVTPDTLIPRPETEHLVEAVLLWATQFHDGRLLRIADVGTGTGAIAIALATHLAGAEFVAVDSSPAALAIAAENANRHNCGELIRFLPSDLLTAFLGAPEPPEIFDAIVSNPPYVALSDAADMQPEVVNFEPHTALFAGHDGLDVYRRLIPQAYTLLRRGGLLALEFGFGQRDALRSLLATPPGAWRDVRFIDDYAGIPRVALADRA